MLLVLTILTLVLCVFGCILTYRIGMLIERGRWFSWLNDSFADLDFSYDYQLNCEEDSIEILLKLYQAHVAAMTTHPHRKTNL